MADVAYIALGSNLGDRAAWLAQARRDLAALPGTAIVAASAVEETAPIGPVEQGPYLNQMLAVRTALAPEELLAAMHEIERRAGRQRRVRWGPRTLDLDLVDMERHRSDDPACRVPHPELPYRDFWRRQLAEVRSALGEGQGVGEGPARG